MNKNIFFIVVDSFSNQLLSNDLMPIVMPYLYSKKDSLVIKNMMSHGPYTEAGIKPLLTGSNSMSDYGYLNRINYSKNNLFSTFKNLGYETSSVYYDDNLYSKDIINQIDNLILAAGMHFISIWDTKFKYYSEILKSDTSKLYSKEINILIDVMENVFLGYDLFFAESANLFLLKKESLSYDFDKNKKLYLKEKEKFELNKEAYLYDLLLTALDHAIFKIEDIKTNDKLIPEIFDMSTQYLKMFKDIKKKQRVSNYKQLMKVKHYKNKKSFLAYYNFVMNNATNFSRPDIYEYLSNLTPSAPKQLNALCKKYTQNSFNYAHLEDLHGYPKYITYDMYEKGLIEQELTIANEYLKKRNNSIGNINYELSMRYTDYHIEKFIKEVSLKNPDSENIFVITGDHGTSTMYKPIRDKNVNTFYLENYMVPLFILNDKNNESYVSEELISSKEIYNIVTNYCKNGFKDCINYLSTIEKFGHIEFMGPGCPDFVRRKMWLSETDGKLLLTGKLNIFDDEAITIEGCFDLEQDPDQLVNLNFDERFSVLHDRLNKRIKELKKEYEGFKNEK